MDKDPCDADPYCSIDVDQHGCMVCACSAEAVTVGAITATTAVEDTTTITVPFMLTDATNTPFCPEVDRDSCDADAYCSINVDPYGCTVCVCSADAFYGGSICPLVDWNLCFTGSALCYPDVDELGCDYCACSQDGTDNTARLSLDILNHLTLAANAKIFDAAVFASQIHWFSVLLQTIQDMENPYSTPYFFAFKRALQDFRASR